MTAQIRVKVIPRFPADVVGGPGITIVRDGRTYTFSLDQATMFAGLPVVTSPTAGDKIILDGETTRAILARNLLREKLPADRTYYVRADGSDSNDGRTDVAGGAFLTPQKFIDTVLYTLDLNGKTVTCELTGAFTSGIRARAPMVGGGVIVITSTAGATITTTSANCIEACNGAQLTVNGNLTLSTIGTGSPNCLSAFAFGRIEYSGITFGAALGSQVQAGYLKAVGESVIDSLIGPGTVVATGSYSVTGGGVSHMHASAAGSHISINTGVVCTLTGTPAFSTYFAGVTNGLIVISGTYSGSATGRRYWIHRGGTIVVPSASRTYIPGDSAGLVAAGGLYCSIDDLLSDYGVGNLVLSEGQIAFPATQNASTDPNTLDDYEESTFTPVLAFGGGSTGITYGTQTGSYTKVGNRVIGEINIVLTSKGSSTGSAQVTGLPFTIGATAAVSISINSAAASVVTQIVGTATAAGTLINLQRMAAGALTSMPDTDFTNTTILRISFTYKV